MFAEEYRRQFETVLDWGISYIVKVLREASIETFESCEGGSGHAFPEPTVRFHGGKGEGFRALSVAFTFGLPVTGLRRYWDVLDGEPVGPKWELTFEPTKLRALQDAAEIAGQIK
jgi:hypothetical protein